ncbi:uncharacterized protein LOC123320134 [Coccinella septempunctata]|uniref:uncharacterized protein LOC123320134 n=1 Tax=Coccinella septempunctata TaxID=41139 RepID=UPI001D0905D1|nr:uncharacterized protein LOC123320134 [Coccinella septempunctata]
MRAAPWILGGGNDTPGASRVSDQALESLPATGRKTEEKRKKKKHRESGEIFEKAQKMREMRQRRLEGKKESIENKKANEEMERSIETIQMGDSDDPFRRSSKLQRTTTKENKEENEGEEMLGMTSTPTEKVESEPEDFLRQWILGDLRPSKRKRTDLSPEISFEEQEIKGTVNSLKALVQDIGDVVGMTCCNEEVKSKLREIQQKLELEATQLATKGQKIKKESIGVQTSAEEIDMNVTISTLRSSLREDMNVEEVRKILNQDWPEEAYQFKVDNRNITSPDIDGDVVLMIPVQEISQVRFLRTLLGTSRKLQQYVYGGKLKEGEIVQHKCGVVSCINGKEVKEENLVYIAGLSKKQEDEEDIIRSIMEIGTKLREEKKEEMNSRYMLQSTADYRKKIKEK